MYEECGTNMEMTTKGQTLLIARTKLGMTFSFFVALSRLTKFGSFDVSKKINLSVTVLHKTFEKKLQKDS